MSLRILNHFKLPERTRRHLGRGISASAASHWEQRKNDGVKTAGENEYLLYGEVGPFVDYGDISAQMVAEWLATREGQDVTVRVNSPGGCVFEGFAIYNALMNHKGKVTGIIDSMAASAASVAIMSTDEIIIEGNAIMMIHQAWTIAAGNATAFRKEAEILDLIDNNIVDTYAARTGRAKEEIKPLVEAETWMNAAQCLEGHFVEEARPLKTKPTEATKTDAVSAANHATFEAALKRFENRTATKVNQPKP